MESISFKNVLHLYVGCKLKDNFMTYQSVMYSVQKNDLYMVACSDRSEVSLWLSSNKAKPILKSIQDISQEDSEEIFNMPCQASAKMQYNDLESWKTAIKSAPDTIVCSCSESWFYLLSRGYDVFNLIEKGEAIRKDS
jgi:hypothetical protein